MTDFASKSMRAATQMAIDHEASANPGSEREHEEAREVPAMAFDHLGQCGSRGVVLDHYTAAEALAQLDGKIGSLEARHVGKAKTDSVWRNDAGHGQAHSLRVWLNPTNRFGNQIEDPLRPIGNARRHRYRIFNLCAFYPSNLDFRSAKVDANHLAAKLPGSQGESSSRWRHVWPKVDSVKTHRRISGFSTGRFA